MTDRGDRRTAALSGRRAIVTGAARGIGTRIAARLLADGADVALLDRDRDGLNQTAKALASELGVLPLTAVADVTDPGAVASAVSTIIDQFGGIDIVVNNAGAWTFGPFEDSSPDQWRLDIDINLFGTINVTRAALPSLIERGYGRVANIVSDSARVGELHVAAYSAAKAGVMGFTRSLAKEVGRHGITVNAISLATILTEAAYDTYSEEQLQRMTRRYPTGRLGDPEDVAGAVRYFAGPDAGWVTGQTLSVNGGYAML